MRPSKGAPSFALDVFPTEDLSHSKNEDVASSLAQEWQMLSTTDER